MLENSTFHELKLEFFVRHEWKVSESLDVEDLEHCKEIEFLIMDRVQKIQYKIQGVPELFNLLKTALYIDHILSDTLCTKIDCLKIAKFDMEHPVKFLRFQMGSLVSTPGLRLSPLQKEI